MGHDSDFIVWSAFVWLAIEVASALYLISFAWFWSLCRISVSEESETEHGSHNANLIPFERGLVLQARKAGGR